MYDIKNFDTFRRWFNQQFSLSFDGKFRGLGTLRVQFGDRFIINFIARIRKLMSRSPRMRPLDDIISFVCLSHRIKLYAR